MGRTALEREGWVEGNYFGRPIIKRGCFALGYKWGTGWEIIHLGTAIIVGKANSLHSAANAAMRVDASDNWQLSLRHRKRIDKLKLVMQQRIEEEEGNPENSSINRYRASRIYMFDQLPQNKDIQLTHG